MTLNRFAPLFFIIASSFSWPTVADEILPLNDVTPAPKIVDILDVREPIAQTPPSTPRTRKREEPLLLKFPRQPIAVPGTMWLQSKNGSTGAPTTLESYRGKWIVLNLWATWCAPCVAEMPTLDKLHRRYNQAGLEVIAVNVDSLQGPSITIPEVESFYRQVGVKYLPAHVDPEAHMAYSMRVQKLPTTFIIDPGGMIIAAADGAEDWFSGAMKRFIEPRLKSLQTPQPETVPSIKDIFSQR